MTRTSLALSTWLLACATPSCSLTFPSGDVQCRVNADCLARGEAFAGSVCADEVCVPPSEPEGWACLGSVEWTSTGPSKPTLTVTVVDVLTSAPPPDLTARACAKLDIDCASPQSDVVGVGEGGQVVVTVGAGFDGYLELRSANIVPALFFVTRPVVDDTVLPGVIPVVSEAGFADIAEAIGTTLDLSTSGHVYALASDCLDARASGVRLDLDKKGEATTPYYMINNAPVGTAAHTDSSGAGGWINVPTGIATISGLVAATGTPIGDATVVVRAGTVSYPRVVPTP